MKNFEKGKIIFEKVTSDVSNIAWKEHASFKGVFLKHIITGADTNGRLSCHLVKIEPQCEIGNHAHDAQLEIHEVISGKGVCMINGKETEYENGIIAVIPEKINHIVKAGPEGLQLFAKFSPPLL